MVIRVERRMSISISLHSFIFLCIIRLTHGKSVLKVKSESVNQINPVRLSATPWTVARQAPLSMEFSRQEYWSG